MGDSSYSDYVDKDNITSTVPSRVLCPNDSINCSTVHERDEDLAKIEMATLAVMFVMTVVGNGAVLAALFARRQSATRTKVPRMNFFMLHLCVADMCTAWLNILPQLAWEVTFRFKGGEFLCKSVKFGQTLGPYLSSYVLTVTALDRYQAICHPLTYCSWSSKRARAMIMGAWALSITFCTPQLTIFSYQEVAPGVFDCWAVFSQPYGERVYVTWLV
ncbi:unnamed protein product [Nezara viridula]|uniref:G-protein coupled receptors family 1 profile domain-containing protein n=1 Tax=Nezara viridula TaxID=85310 RepID=A0A9P0EAH6_NEZVI|nr:unnamed protein product [Nezara viridula]